jgi:hypothetical protein
MYSFAPFPSLKLVMHVIRPVPSCPPTDDHADPFHFATLLAVIFAAVKAYPPRYSAGPVPSSKTVIASGPKSVLVEVTPPPTELHAVPFHRAIPDVPATPLIEEKRPATYSASPDPSLCTAIAEMNGLKLPPTDVIVGVHRCPSHEAIPAHGCPAICAGWLITPPPMYSCPPNTAIAHTDCRVDPVQPVPIASHEVPFHIARLAVLGTPPAVS